LAIGIDIANSMLKKAEKFSQINLFDERSDFRFFNNWNHISDDLFDSLVSFATPLFFNASYLFASESLDEDDLASFIIKVVKRHKSNKVFFIFQNPDRPDRNIKYNKFKRVIVDEIPFKTHERKVEKIGYKTNPHNTGEPSLEVFYYEILSLTQSFPSLSFQT